MYPYKLVKNAVPAHLVDQSIWYLVSKHLNIRWWSVINLEAIALSSVFSWFDKVVENFQKRPKIVTFCTNYCRYFVWPFIESFIKMKIFVTMHLIDNNQKSKQKWLYGDVRRILRRNSKIHIFWRFRIEDVNIFQFFIMNQCYVPRVLTSSQTFWIFNWF